MINLQFKSPTLEDTVYLEVVADLHVIMSAVVTEM